MHNLKYNFFLYFRLCNLKYTHNSEYEKNRDIHQKMKKMKRVKWYIQFLYGGVGREYGGATRSRQRKNEKL